MSGSTVGKAAAPMGRERHIETMRGLACLLLVAFHVVGNDAAHGFQVSDGSGWRFFTELFMHVRMPLFSFISGYVFSAAAADSRAFRHALIKKLRRIGLPFLTVSTLFYICFGIFNHGNPSPLWQIYVLPYEHFWYLQATLLIMTALLAGNLLARRHARIATTLALPVAAAVFLLGPIFSPEIFSINSALYLLPFFLMGQTLRLWKARDMQAGQRVPLAVLLGLLLALLFGLDAAHLAGANALDFSRQAPLGLLFGLTTCLCLFAARIRIGFLERIGFYSYTIYLFHVFFTAAVDKSLHAIAPTVPHVVVFALAVPAGILLPIVLHQVIIRYRWPALLLLGIDRRPNEAPARAVAPVTAAS